jgi:HEAT repeat protein
MPDINELIKDLADENPQKQSAAVEELVNMGPEALTELTAALQNGSPVRRQSAAVAMGKIGDKSATEALKTALGDDDDAVQKAAAWALKKIGA